METAPPNPYGNLSVDDLERLRQLKQERYEQIAGQYHDAYADWALVMNALKGVLHEQRSEQARPLSA